MGKALNAAVMVMVRDYAAIFRSHDYTVPLDAAGGLKLQIGTNVAAVPVCALIIGGSLPCCDRSSDGRGVFRGWLSEPGDQPSAGER